MDVYPKYSIVLNGQENGRDNTSSHTAVDTDPCHQMIGPCRPHVLEKLAQALTTSANYIVGSSGAGKPSESGYPEPAKQRTDEVVDHGSAEPARDEGIYPNALAGTLILTQEITTKTTPETYGIAGTCPTDWPNERRTVRIVDIPVISTEDTAEEASLSTEDTAEQPSLSSEDTSEGPSLSTEDTTIFSSATKSLFHIDRCAAMGLMYCDDAEEDGIHAALRHGSFHTW